MPPDHLIDKADSYLHTLCVEIPSRRVGSAGNRAATDFFARTAESFGFSTESPPFDCIDWQHAGADLSVGGEAFEVFPGPYALGCRVSAPLAVVSTIGEMETSDVSGRVVLLRGEIASEQLMPKNFPFYNPDHHRQIIGLLEAKQPQAIIAATSRDVVMVGSQYPFPLFEDGDFDIPSVYMTEEEGDRLAAHAGEIAALESRAERIAATGCNVIARKGADPQRRVVLFAHIDARMGTPGAGDNASGTIALLLLAELLADYSGDLSIELVAMNGEDYFSSPGEQQWLALNAGKLNEIVLGINLDDVGYVRGNVAYSLYGCPPDMADLIHGMFAGYTGLIEGEQWVQGDHGLFVFNEIPALAFTSELVAELMAEITHTPKDTPETIDRGKLATVALALKDLLLKLDGIRR
jgi:aminopeptidase YwaD